MARTRLFALLFLVALVGGQVLPTKFVRAQDDDGSGDDGGDGGADYGDDYGDADAGDGDVPDVPDGSDGSDGSDVPDGGDGGDGGADFGADYDGAELPPPTFHSDASPYIGSDGDDGSNDTLAGGLGSGWPWGGCGWNSKSCVANNPNVISVGLWLCSYSDPADCECGWGGCKSADAGFALYYLNVDGSDNACDSRGGWRWNDPHYDGGFGDWVGSIHYEVHPDDTWKVNSLDDVKVNLHQGDYCTGATAGGYTYWAWDDNNLQPGQWSLDDTGSGIIYSIKSVRPYVDQYVAQEPGIGIKFVGWPGGHMWPYDEIRCDNSEMWDVVCDSNGQNCGCASAIDRVYCVEPDDYGKNDAFGEWNKGAVDFAGNQYAPQDWINAAGGVPLGSFMFEVYQGEDKWNCDYNWFDFCTGGNPQDYCLAARFFNQGANVPTDWDASWNDMIGETWINMGYLCDNYGQNGFCINTYDGSNDPEDADVCTNFWLTDQSGNPVDEWPIYVYQVWTRIVTSNGIC